MWRTSFREEPRLQHPRSYPVVVAVVAVARIGCADPFVASAAAPPTIAFVH